MFELKPLARESIPEALKKAERYRFLNEPLEAESICRDILEVEPEDQAAIVVLLLSLTDQFSWNKAHSPVSEARELLGRLTGKYERAYYAGIISERQAKALIREGRPRTEFRAHHWLTEAMEWYEKAESLRPPGNDDAILRWNTCVRILESHPNVRHEPEGEPEAAMLE